MLLLPLLLAAQAVAPPARATAVQAGAVSVQAAVDAAAPGDTVRLGSGIHQGPVVIAKPLTLLGMPGATLDGGRRGTVLTVRADSVVIEGLVLTGSGRSLDRDEAAIRLEECTGCRISGSTITEPLHGIYLLRSQGVTIERNEITGSAALEEPLRGNGIHLFSSSGNRIAGNRIRSTRDGIYFSFASGNRVVDNDVSGVRYGLHYMYSDDNVFERNRFTRNAAGAAIMFSKRITLRENTFSRHVGYRAYGILLQTGEDIVAERNRIEGNLTGLFLDGAVRNVFRENVVSGNGVGIDLLASAEDNLFTRNVIADNRIPVRKVLGTGRNAWDDGRAGNFWNDAAVFDLDGDGIGDRPYRVGDTWASLAATRPSLELFGGTLAARALGWAEEAFPVFDVPRVEDERPLASAPAAPATAADASPPATHPIRKAGLLVALLVTYGGGAGLLRRRTLRRAA
ncbi:MAG TPA: nitrous oxide reductase family maturation protein NosD [Gemmatimonadales bacterium]